MKQLIHGPGMHCVCNDISTLALNVLI